MISPTRSALSVRPRWSTSLPPLPEIDTAANVPDTHGPAPKVVDNLDAIKSQGLTEVDPAVAKWLTCDPLASALGSRLDQLMTYWGRETVVVIRHPQQEWNGRKYREFIIAPYPMMKH